jgi:hypothetical protein
MSAEESRVAICAALNNGNGVHSGHVRVFEYPSDDLSGSFNSTWSQIGNDIDGVAMSDEIGWSVAMSANGSRIVVGTPWNFD